MQLAVFQVRARRSFNRVLTCVLVIAATSALYAQSDPQTPAASNSQPPGRTQSDELQGRQPVPYQLPSGVTVERDLVYAKNEDKEESLDLYRPASGAGRFPGVLFIHGGGWSGGSKADFQRQAAYLATKGYVCISINYRLSQEAPYPAALYDAKAAVRWMRANATKYQIDPNRIAAAGGSAGGQLAALLGTTADVKTMEGSGGNGQFSSRVQAVVAFNPLTDFVSMLSRTQNLPAAQKAIYAFLGGPLERVPEVYMMASPVAHVSASSAPFLFLHGTADTTMPFSQSLEMQAALQAVGVRAELYSAEGGNHGFFNFPPYYEPALLRMEKFLGSIFK